MDSVSGRCGSLDGASPLNLSWGHGGGLSSYTFVQSGVGHRWAKEAILKMTERVNLSSFKEKTAWHGETHARSFWLARTRVVSAPSAPMFSCD